MSDPVPEIRMVPVDLITILNPRVRNKRIFQELVDSIAHLGLKKPITVSQRAGKTRYDLVCGQGRLEAFIALGQSEIPAIIVDASEEDCYVMSLVENLARRQHSPLELVHAIGVLAARGYSHSEIAAKVDFSYEYVAAICVLLDNGEEKLISAVERGVIARDLAALIGTADHQTSAPPPNEKNDRKKLDAAKAIERPKTIWIRRRKPPEVSPNASVRPVVMMMITAMILATGPSIDWRMDCSGASHGMEEPEAWAAGAIMAVMITADRAEARRRVGRRTGRFIGKLLVRAEG